MALTAVRTHSHAACQWVTKAARANLEAVADDSHSNMGWLPSISCLVSHRLDKTNSVGFSFETASLLILDEARISAECPLQGATDTEAGRWLDTQLKELGLRETRHAVMPYQLEAVPTRYDFDLQSLIALGRWFSIGFAILPIVIEQMEANTVNKPSVRCWPHHYDVGGLMLLDDDDPETARSIGVGLSPGDNHYAEPYFYCNPWPVPPVQSLGEAPTGLRWHVDGFVSLIATATSLQSGYDMDEVVAAAVNRVKELLTVSS